MLSARAHRHLRIVFAPLARCSQPVARLDPKVVAPLHNYNCPSRGLHDEQSPDLPRKPQLEKQPRSQLDTSENETVTPIDSSANKGTDADQSDREKGSGADRKPHHVEEIRDVSESEAFGALTLPIRHTLRLLNINALNLGFPGAWTSYQEFREGAIQAVETVHRLVGAEDFPSLRRLVGDELLEELQDDVAETETLTVTLSESNPLGIWNASPRSCERTGANFVQIVVAFDILEKYLKKCDARIYMIQRLNWVTFERMVNRDGDHGDWQIVAISKKRSRIPLSSK